MTKSIRTYDELQQERARLELLLAAQKDLVRQDFNEIKEELKPVRSVISTIGKFTTKDNRGWVLSTAADTLIDMVIKRIVLNKAGFFTRMVVPFFMKNFSSHIIADNKEKIMSKLSSLFGKKHANGKMPVTEEEKKEHLAEEEED